MFQTSTGENYSVIRNVWLRLSKIKITFVTEMSFKSFILVYNYSQMLDANQRWDVKEAIEWVSRLAEFKPLWIEEPTSPDDILGHATIAKVRRVVLHFSQMSE